MISGDQISKKGVTNKWVTGSKRLGIYQEHFWERDKLHLPAFGCLSLNQMAEAHSRKGLFTQFLKKDDAQEEPIVCLKNLPEDYNHRESVSQFLDAKTLKYRLRCSWSAEIDRLLKQPVFLEHA